MRPIIVTCGEPAGIGPELCARLAERDWPLRPVVLGDIGLRRERELDVGEFVGPVLEG